MKFPVPLSQTLYKDRDHVKINRLQHSDGPPEYSHEQNVGSLSSWLEQELGIRPGQIPGGHSPRLARGQTEQARSCYYEISAGAVIAAKQS